MRFINEATEMEAPPRKSTVAIIVDLGNPVFILLAVVLPNAALAAAMASGSLTLLNFVHVMAGVLWTGIDLFLGFVLGPALRAMEPAQRAQVFKRLIPRTTFLLPMLAGVTIMAGLELAQRLGLLTFDSIWTMAALVITAALVVQGFGMLLPNDIRIFKELISATPNVDKIVRLGTLNLRLAASQGLCQLAIVYVMANLRF
ncbi:MAG TPA: hypothetical protein VIH40_06095 [Xanthobacteraceae bacterium]